ncbi:MAG: ABC transporter ATP-binding protein [Actinobacteria bacterium]|nr:ABC transporter ATP-binding protein [Actinomycetota bacterium]
MIYAENLTKRFNNITAVDNISFNINEGQIFGFLGPNGAGKTTTVRILSTLIKPTAGKVIIDGRDIKSNGDYIRSILGILTETPGMYEKISAYENLDYFSGFYSIGENRRKQNIEKFLKMFELWERRNDPVKSYSKGMKQKLALARALIHEPKILFLDEPTAGLDPESAFMVRNFIEDLKNDTKTTVFLCTHNLEEASSLSDIVCIIKGKIISISTLEELQNNKKGKRVEVIIKNGPDKFMPIFSEFKEIIHSEAAGNKINLTLENPETINPVIIKKLTDAGAEIVYFNEIKASLEEIYLDLIKN